MSYPSGNIENQEIITASAKPFDVKRFIFRIIDFSPWIILCTIIAYSISWTYLRYQPRLHQISAHILIKDDQEGSSDYNLLRELGVMPGSKELQDQIDILESLTLARTLVDTVNLQVKLITNGIITNSEVYGRQSPVKIKILWNDSLESKPASYSLQLYNKNFSINQNGKPVFYNYGEDIMLNNQHFVFTRNEKISLNAEGYTLLMQDKTVVATDVKNKIYVQKMNEMGSTLSVSFPDEIPERGIDIINKLVESFNNAGLIDKNLVSARTNTFLGERLSDVSFELDSLELLAESFKRKNKISDITQAGTQYLQQSMVYDKSKEEQESQIQMIDLLENYITNSKNSLDIIPSNNGLAEPTLLKLIDLYNQSVLSLQQQLKISTDKDPVLGRNRSELSDIKTDILKNINTIRNAYRINLTKANEKKNGFDELLNGLPEKEREFLKLQRLIGVKEQIYLFLLQKKEDAQLTLAANLNNTRVVDSAFDMGIISPKEQEVKMIAILLGIIIPIFLMIILDFFNNKISARTEIEEVTNVPILGELAFVSNPQNVLVTFKSKSIIAEQFRLIRTNLRYFITKDKPAQTLLITSFMSGEGKSFTSINMSASIAASGSKVLLIEFDLRKPKLASYLNINPKYGVSDFIINKVPFNELLTNFPNLKFDVITSGPMPPNPAEILMNDNLKDLFSWARENYDYIIMDTSPVGLVADAFLLDKFADVSMFILRYKYSYKSTIEYIDKLQKEKDMKSLGIVVNGVKSQRNWTYKDSYGYGYGYGYNYGVGYYEKGGGKLKSLFTNPFKGKKK